MNEFEHCYLANGALGDGNLSTFALGLRQAAAAVTPIRVPDRVLDPDAEDTDTYARCR